jgi:hypothetical protein
MVQYQEHHLGGGGCLKKVAFKQGDFKSSRSPGSLSLPASGYVATGIIHSKFSELVVGLVLAPPCAILCRRGQTAVPNRILDGRRNLNLFRQLGV